MNKMKSMVLSTLWVLALTVIFSACSSEKESYLSSLPSESSIVLKLNVVQMTQKSNIMNNPMVSGLLMQAEGQIPETLKAKFDEIKQDPRNAGIDLEKPLAVSVILNNIEKPQIVAVVALSNADKFDDLMLQLASAEESVTIEKLNNGLQRINIKGNNEAEFVYNDNRIVLTVGMDATKLITQQAEQSILSNPDFKEFAETTNDYSIFFDYKWISETLKQQNYANLSLPPTFELIKDCSAFFTLNFEKGKIVGKTKIYASEGLKQLQETFYLKPSGKFIGLLPTDTYLAINGGTKNFAEIFNMMGENEKQEIEKALQQLGLSKEIFNSIEGDVTFGVFDEANPQGIPGFILAAECKDRNLFDAIKKMTQNESTEGDVLNIMGYYITYMDGSLIATTQNIYEQCLAEGTIKDLSKSLKNTSMRHALEKSGIVIDFQAIAQNKFLNQMKRERKIKAALNVLDQLNILTAQYDNLQEGSAELTFKDTEKNALEQLISIGFSIAMLF